MHLKEANRLSLREKCFLPTIGQRQETRYLGRANANARPERFHTYNLQPTACHIRYDDSEIIAHQLKEGLILSYHPTCRRCETPAKGTGSNVGIINNWRVESGQELHYAANIGLGGCSPGLASDN